MSSWLLVLYAFNSSAACAHTDLFRLGGVHEGAPHCTEVVHWMRLGVVIGQISATLLPRHIEFFLLDLVSNPVVAHVDGLRALEFDVRVCDTYRTLVVADDGGCVLWVTESGQDVSCVGGITTY